MSSALKQAGSPARTNTPGRHRWRASRPAPVLHLQALVRRPSLDEAIALGDRDGQPSPQLELRARQLTGARHRRMVANGFDRALAELERPRRGFSAAVPVDRAEVQAARPALLELVSLLRSEEPLAARGVALAERLLTDGGGPLYVRSTPDALWHAARRACACMRPD